MLILHSATFLNLYINFNRFLVESLEIFMHNILSSVNRGSFTSFFLIWLPFISFYYLIVLARMNRVVRMSGAPYLAPNLKGNTLN